MILKGKNAKNAQCNSLIYSMLNNWPVFDYKLFLSSRKVRNSESVLELNTALVGYEFSAVNANILIISKLLKNGQTNTRVYYLRNA